jgi:hypothetical protein
MKNFVTKREILNKNTKFIELQYYKVNRVYSLNASLALNVLTRATVIRIKIISVVMWVANCKYEKVIITFLLLYNTICF